MDSDLTVHILQEIRDEIRMTRAELGGLIDATNSRVDALAIELRTTREELRAEIRATNLRVTEIDLRHATQMNELIGVMKEIHATLETNGRLEGRVSRCENDIAELKTRIPKKPD